MDSWTLLFVTTLSGGIALCVALLVMALHVYVRHGETPRPSAAMTFWCIGIALALVFLGLWIFGTTAAPYMR